MTRNERMRRQREVARRLRLLANEMSLVGGYMVALGGLFAKHGAELAGAANMAGGWATEIEAELDKQQRGKR